MSGKIGDNPQITNLTGNVQPGSQTEEIQKVVAQTIGQGEKPDPKPTSSLGKALAVTSLGVGMLLKGIGKGVGAAGMGTVAVTQGAAGLLGAGAAYGASRVLGKGHDSAMINAGYGALATGVPVGIATSLLILPFTVPAKIVQGMGELFVKPGEEYKPDLYKKLDKAVQPSAFAMLGKIVLGDKKEDKHFPAVSLPRGLVEKGEKGELRAEMKEREALKNTELKPHNKNFDPREKQFIQGENRPEANRMLREKAAQQEAAKSASGTGEKREINFPEEPSIHGHNLLKKLEPEKLTSREKRHNVKDGLEGLRQDSTQQDFNINLSLKGLNEFKVDESEEEGVGNQSRSEEEELGEDHDSRSSSENEPEATVQPQVQQPIQQPTTTNTTTTTTTTTAAQSSSVEETHHAEVVPKSISDLDGPIAKLKDFRAKFEDFSKNLPTKAHEVGIKYEQFKRENMKGFKKEIENFHALQYEVNEDEVETEAYSTRFEEAKTELKAIEQAIKKINGKPGLNESLKIHESDYNLNVFDGIVNEWDARAHIS